jgi:nondiscriminating glutamyl-tRNA synthetase
MEKTEIRVRIAPSPTGFTHIGTLRTALTNFLFARRYKGKFVIRLEDTDQKRLVKESAADLVNSLRWAGIDWDEGIDLDANGNIIEKGNYGPYINLRN